MWYRFAFAESRDIIEPGSVELKPGYRRGFHSILRGNDDTIQQILNEGLRIDRCKGESYGEPNMIWATTGEFYNPSVPNVEFQISPEHIENSFVPGRSTEYDAPDRLDKHWAKPNNEVVLRLDVPPEDIIAIHEPWHRYVRLLKERPERIPELIESLKRDMPGAMSEDKKDLQKAIQYMIDRGY